MMKRIIGIAPGYLVRIKDFIGEKTVLNQAIFSKILLLISNLRHLKIRTRLILSFAVLSLIPLLTVSIFSYHQYTNSINAKLSKSSFQLLEQLDRNILTEIGRCEHICDQLSIDSLIQDSLLNYQRLDDLAKNKLLLAINDLLVQKGLLFYYIQNIYIFTSKGESLYDLGYDSFDNESINRFIKGTNKNNPLDYWTFARTRRGADSLVLCRTINQISDTSVKLGYLFVVINNSDFSNWTYTDVDMGKGSNVFILDGDGTVLSRINHEIPLGRPYPDRMLFKKMLMNQKKSVNTFTTNWEGKKSLVLYVYNSRTKWYMVATIPYSYIRSETSSINTGLILLSIGCLFFSIVVSIIITLSIDAPIRRMVNTIKNVSGGNLEIRINDEYDDEMGYLSQKFDAMIGQLKAFNRQYREDQKRKRELELNMLQAQINPHFLFNTLNSLKWTAQMSRVTTVSDGLVALSDLLRNTIIDKNERITLKEELKNIENYLLIQKIRYGDSFRAFFDIEEDVKENLILKFLLQPIVENSIIHGLPDNKRQVTITIKGYQSQDNMEISIQDDGKGFDPKAVSDKNSIVETKGEKLSAIGIDNVRERIVLNFGDEYGLFIKSSVGSGTEVIMKLPVIKSS